MQSRKLQGNWRKRVASEWGLPLEADIRIMKRRKASATENFTTHAPWLESFARVLRNHGLRWNNHLEIKQNPSGGQPGYRLSSSKFISAGTPLLTVPKNCRFSAPQHQFRLQRQEPVEFGMARNLLGFLNLNNQAGIWEPHYCEFLFNNPPAHPEGGGGGGGIHHQGLATHNLPYFGPGDLKNNKFSEKKYYWYQSKHRMLEQSVNSFCIPHCAWATSIVYSRSHVLPFGEGSEGHVLCPLVDCLRHHFDPNCEITFQYSYPSYILDKLSAEEKAIKQDGRETLSTRQDMRKRRTAVFHQHGLVPTTIPPTGGEQPSFLNVIAKNDIPIGQPLSICYSTVGVDPSDPPRCLRDPLSDASRFWKERYGFVPEDPTKGRARPVRTHHHQNTLLTATGDSVATHDLSSVEATALPTSEVSASTPSSALPPVETVPEVKKEEANHDQKQKPVNGNLMDILGLSHPK